jgi:hypothetical protein
MHDTYSPDPPDTTCCPHCGTAAAPPPALSPGDIRLVLTRQCATCHGEWADVLSPTEQRQYLFDVPVPAVPRPG